MAARSLDLQVTTHPGAEVLHRRFTRFVSHLTDLEPLFHDLAGDLRDAAEGAFKSQGASTGPQWAPLSDSYREAKAMAYPGKTILRRTDVLYRSLVGEGAGHVEAITNRSMLWGTEVPYAGFHQGGTSRMKARPIIRLSGAHQSDMTKTVHRYLLEHARGLVAGGRIS